MIKTNFKKENLRDCIVTCVFIAVLAVLFFGIFVQYIYNHYPVSRLVSVTGENSIDWEALYPFEEAALSSDPEDNPDNHFSSNFTDDSDDNIISNYGDNSGSSVVAYRAEQFGDKIKSVEGKIKSLEDLIEDAVNVNFPFRTRIIEMNGRLMKLVGIRKFPGPTVDIGDEHLVLLTEEKDTSKAAGAVNDFADFLDDRNIPFLQVVAPSKVVPGVTNLRGYIDYADSNTDYYLKRLDGDADVLDLRIEMNKDFGTESRNDLFFRTDHHWLYSTGLWAAEKTAKRLNADFDFDIPEDVFDRDLYMTKTYEKWLLGSLGKKVTTGYIEPDDLKILFPKENTSFHVTVQSLDIDAEGDFYDTMIYQKILSERHYYDWDAYWALGYGDRALIQSDNLNIDDEKKLLIVKDSFADSVWPYLAMGVDKIDVIDMRRFKGSLRTYIDTTKPDAVVFLYSNGSVPEGEPERESVFYLN